MNRLRVRSRGVAVGLLAAFALGAGCSSNNEGKIEGTVWSSQSTMVDKQMLPAGALQLEFAKDGAPTYIAGPQTFTGKYTIGSGDYVTFKLNQSLAGRKNHVQRVSIKGDVLTLKDSDGTAVTFNRAESLQRGGMGAGPPRSFQPPRKGGFE